MSCPTPSLSYTGQWAADAIASDDGVLQLTDGLYFITIANYTFTFDAERQCCEKFGVLFGAHDVDDDADASPGDSIDLGGSTGFHLESKMMSDVVYDPDSVLIISLDNGQQIRFYCSHNGYYAHVVTIQCNGEVKFKTYL